MSESDPEGDESIAARMARELDRVRDGPVDGPREAARRVGESVRRFIDRLTATSAPPEVLDEVTDRMTELVETLGGYGVNRRYQGIAEASGLGRDATFFDWSPLLGSSNPLAPPIRVEIQGDVVIGIARFGAAYEGPPGCVHGGFVAAAFDEVLGLTQSLSGQVGMTGTLTIKYRRPTPLHTELRFEGRLDSVNGRKVQATCHLYAGDVLTAEATGLFITITPERFGALAAHREQVWPDGSSG